MLILPVYWFDGYLYVMIKISFIKNQDDTWGFYLYFTQKKNFFLRDKIFLNQVSFLTSNEDHIFRSYCEMSWEVGNFEGKIHL